MKSVGVYAVIRLDNYPDGIAENIAENITVKEILPTREEAEAEVQRLNELNKDKQCNYFWQYTRFYKDGR